MKRLGITLAIVVFAPALALAHGGGLDKYGCHHDKKAGDYHCHKGEHKDQSFKSQEEMLAAAKKGGKAAKTEKAEKADMDKKAAATKK